MNSLFHKALVISDAHFGRSGNSIIANQDNIDFLRWAIETAKTWGAETCLMLGDWFHNRSLVGVETMHFALKGLEMISTGFKQSFFISGNHDQFFKTRRDITSVEIINYIPNITLINDPLTIGDITFLPWLMPGEHKTLDLSSTRYLFGHFELSGFLSNTGHQMPEGEHSQTVDAFRNPEYVFTGHFHARQNKKNVCYIGNFFPFDFSDAGDSNRGIMLLEYGKEPEFRSWPDQPLYQTMTLSQMLSEPEKLASKMTVRVTIDLPLRYEEAQELRNSMITDYGLRKIELINGHLDGEQDFDDAKVQFKSVDQIVISGLESIDSKELSSGRLIEIYTGLG